MGNCSWFYVKYFKKIKTADIIKDHEIIVLQFLIYCCYEVRKLGRVGISS